MLVSDVRPLPHKTLIFVYGAGQVLLNEVPGQVASNTDLLNALRLISGTCETRSNGHFPVQRM